MGTDTISIEYASNGNIESKSDLGDYAYSSIHPNAVVNVSGSDSIDLNEEDISYTSFNKIDSLTQGDNSISFLYGSDYSRKKSVINVNNVETVKFYSGIYEKSITLGQTKELYYIMAYGSIVAMYKKTATEGNMYYVHTDHLGSVNCVTDNTGSIVQESSYDPWGNRRDPVTLEKLDTVPTNLITTRGYTGHEHMDAFGLINMNGRVYDPNLARFLNPDPVIANPTFTQDYNAYSYVRNNPLGYVDPSGYIAYDVMMPRYFGGVPGSGGLDGRLGGGGMPQMCKNGVNSQWAWDLAWLAYESQFSNDVNEINRFLKNSSKEDLIKNNAYKILSDYDLNFTMKYVYDGVKTVNEIKNGESVCKGVRQYRLEITVTSSGKPKPKLYTEEALEFAASSSAEGQFGTAIGVSVLTVVVLHDLIVAISSGIEYELTNKKQKHPADGTFVDKGHQYIFPPDPNQDPSGSVPLAELLLLRLIDNWIDAVTPNESETPNNNSDSDNNQLYYYIMPIE